MEPIVNNPPSHSSLLFLASNILYNCLEHTHTHTTARGKLEVIFKPTLCPTFSAPGFLAWHGDTYSIWQVLLWVHHALHDLCPAAVAKVTSRHVAGRAVFQSVSAGHNLSLDGSTHKCPQDLHCHSCHQMSKGPTLGCSTSNAMQMKS